MSAFVPHHYHHVPEGWRRACQLVDHVQFVLGATIKDAVTGKRMDAGQAICREAYGVNWMDSVEFKSANAAEAAPREYLDAALRLIHGEATWVSTAVAA